MGKTIVIRPIKDIGQANKNPGGDELDTHVQHEKNILHRYEDYVPSEVEASVTKKLTNLISGYYHSPEGVFPLTEYFYYITDEELQIFDRLGVYLLSAGIWSFTFDEIDWIQENLPMYQTGENLQDKSQIHIDFTEMRNEGWMVWRRSGTYNQLIGYIREILPYTNIINFIPVNTHRDLSIYTHMHLGNFTHRQLAAADLTTWEIQDDLKYYFDDRDDFCIVTREEMQIINAFIDSKREYVPVHDLVVDYTKLNMFIKDEQYVTVRVYPLNATNKKVAFTVGDPTLVKVTDNTIKALDEGITTVTVTSEDNPDVYKEIDINIIEADHLINETYEIVRETDIYDIDESYIIGFEPDQAISTVLSTFKNREADLRVYDKDGNDIPVENWYQLLSTGMQIALVANGKEYDRVRVIIRGDISGDGVVTLNELQYIRDHVNGVKLLTGYQFIAADVDKDGLVTLYDLNNIEMFIDDILATLN